MSRRSGALVRIIAWHCILGIGMGVAALIVVLSVMNGFNLTIRARMMSVEPHLVVFEKGAARAADLESRVKMAAKSGLDRIDRFESQDLIVRSLDGQFGGVIAKGYGNDTISDLLKRTWLGSHKGDLPSDWQGVTLGPREVILGADLGRSLGVFEGDEVLLVPPEALLLPKGEIPKFQHYRVRQLISTQIPELDAKLLFYFLGGPNERIRSVGQETGFEVRLLNPYEADDVKRAIKNDYNVQTWSERDTSLFFALKMESYAMTLFLILAVLITSFSIVIIMVLLLNQKKQDIGLFLAMGLPIRKLKLMFLKVGLLLSFVGILSGFALGVSICLILDFYPLELLPDVYTDTTLPAKMSTRLLVFVLCTSSLIAVLGAWLPVWKYRLSTPTEALRKPLL